MFAGRPVLGSANHIQAVTKPAVFVGSCDQASQKGCSGWAKQDSRKKWVQRSYLTTSALFHKRREGWKRENWIRPETGKNVRKKKRNVAGLRRKTSGTKSEKQFLWISKDDKFTRGQRVGRKRIWGKGPKNIKLEKWEGRDPEAHNSVDRKKEEAKKKC